MRRIKKVRVAEGIFLARFATQYELASTFLRFQEYAESSRFAGRIFSIEEFMDWYASQFGKFSYFEDWTGFNVPSTALEPFFAGRFDPLLEKEKRLLALFKKERKPFYIIGVTESSSRDDAGIQHPEGRARTPSPRLQQKRSEGRSTRLPRCR